MSKHVKSVICAHLLRCNEETDSARPHQYSSLAMAMSQTAHFLCVCVLAITCRTSYGWTLSSSLLPLNCADGSTRTSNSLALFAAIRNDHSVSGDVDSEKTNTIQNILLQGQDGPQQQSLLRRSFCQNALIGSFLPTMLLATTTPLLSVIAPALAQPAEFQNIATQTPAVREGDPTFVTLANGVKIADFVVGQGDAVPDININNNAGAVRVDIQCNGRLLNLNGISFYNTKNNNPDGFGALPLTLILGRRNQDATTTSPLPGLEAGLVGMRKGGIRRIIVPSDLAYSKFPNLQPQPMSDVDRRALDSVLQNPRRDATIMFDVKLERFKTL
jgi:FKBP-type peptidyl-prolyl cis-trans isomerase